MGEVESSGSMHDEVLKAVEQHELPGSIQRLLETYEEIVGDRDRFFWRWLADLFPAFTLSCVDSEFVSDIQTAKLLASIFVTVLDDVAEKHDDRPTFEEAAKVPFAHQSSDPDRVGVDSEVLTYVDTIWERFEKTPKGPREAEFRELMIFDLRQVVNAIDYSYLGNHHLNAVTEGEVWTHDIHNMAVFVYADLDLMCSPGFNANELSLLRQLIAHAERIARICNWTTTWERELHEGDCTSGVIVYALKAGIVGLEELHGIRDDPREDNVAPVIRSINDHNVEAYFEQRLQEEFQSARKLSENLESVDGDAYLDGFETVQHYHAATRGRR